MVTYGTEQFVDKAGVEIELEVIVEIRGRLFSCL